MSAAANQPISVFLCKIRSTPQRASSSVYVCVCVCSLGWVVWNLGSQAEHEDTTAARWNNRVVEVTALHGSYYPLGLSEGWLECGEGEIKCRVQERDQISPMKVFWKVRWQKNMYRIWCVGCTRALSVMFSTKIFFFFSLLLCYFQRVGAPLLMCIDGSLMKSSGSQLLRWALAWPEQDFSYNCGAFRRFFLFVKVIYILTRLQCLRIAQ